MARSTSRPGGQRPLVAPDARGEYPFRFYGVDPAAWGQSDERYPYELRFQSAPDQRVRRQLAYAFEVMAGNQDAQTWDDFAPEGAMAWEWAGDWAAFLVRLKHPPGDWSHGLSDVFMALHALSPLAEVHCLSATGESPSPWEEWSRARAPAPAPAPRWRTKPAPKSVFSALQAREEREGAVDAGFEADRRAARELVVQGLVEEPEESRQLLEVILEPHPDAALLVEALMGALFGAGRPR
jgi:hypothetical protein